MDPYTFCLLLGALGLVGMSLTGIGRHGHAGHAPVRAGHGHAPGAAHAASHAGSHAGHSGGGAAARALLSLMSPRVLFSALLGAGATGLLLGRFIHGVPLAGAAVAGGLLFEMALARPVWNATMRFASRPALTLESCVTDSATAVTSFDAQGHGVVAIELDGQVVQVLATLIAGERTAGATVRAGDRVRIDAVDADRNRCTVSLL